MHSGVSLGCMAVKGTSVNEPKAFASGGAGQSQSPPTPGCRQTRQTRLQVAERGLAFVRSISDILGARQAEDKLDPLFREAWAFSACVSLAENTYRANAALRASQLSAAEGQQTLGLQAGCTLSPHTHF